MQPPTPDHDASDPHATAAADEADASLPSKSQRKRDADAIRALGLELAALSPAERARIDLPDVIHEAIDLLNRTTQRGAHKRQASYLAKQLRRIDVAPIEAALARQRQAARLQARQHHKVEHWRDRLLDRDPDLPAADALTALLDEFPQADRQQLRQLQRKALDEQQSGRTPRAARQLFQALRTLLLDDASEPDG